jgi:hypothetical protein
VSKFVIRKFAAASFALILLGQCAAMCTLDVDDDGNTLATTDGLLAIRYLLGFRGDSLTANAVNPAGLRTASNEIADYLASECDVTTVPPTGFAARGIYTGTATGNLRVYGLVTERGKLWGMYTDPVTAQNPNPRFAGFFHGLLSLNGNAVTGSNIRDTYFGDQSTVRAQPTGTFTPSTSLNVSVFYPLYNASTAVNTIYSSLSNQSISLPQLAGSYSGYAISSLYPATNFPASNASNVTVNPDGTFFYSSPTCAFSGRFSPRENGMYFDVKVTFSEYLCVYPLAQMRGAAVYDASTRELVAVVTNRDENIGFLIYGAKP